MPYHMTVVFNSQVYYRNPGTSFIPCNALLHQGSCLTMALKDFYTSLWIFFKLYAALYSLPLVLFKGRKLIQRPSKSLLSLFQNSFRSALFFSLDAAVVKYMLCLLRNVWPHPPPLPVFIPFLAGMIGSLGLLIERAPRRIELMYYVFPQV